MILRGAFWIAVALTVSKFAGIISQVVLGAILDPEDFGLFAILLSLGAVVAVVSNGGTQQVLVQEGDRYSHNVPLVFNYALGFNLLAAAALVAVSFPMASHYENPVLTPMAGILAASILAGTPGLILKSRLSIDLRFKQLGLLMAVSNIGRHASAIVLALAGAGVFSLTVPVLVQPVLITLIAWIIVREWPAARRVSREEYVDLFGKTRWLMASTLALALLQHGRYLPVSLFVSTASLGVFFFAAQLITSVVSLFTGAIKEIFFPFFARLEAGTELFGQRVRLLLVVLTATGFTLAVATYLLAEPVIALVWGGRWDAAAICVLWLSLLFPAQLLFSLGIALIDSQGLWKLRLRQLALYGCGDLVVSFLAASTGSVALVAASVGIYRVTVAFFLLRHVLVRITDITAEIDKDMALLTLVPLVPLALSRLVSVDGALASIALGLAWVAALVALYALLLGTPRFVFVYSYLRELKNRKQKSP